MLYELMCIIQLHNTDLYEQRILQSGRKSFGARSARFCPQYVLNYTSFWRSTRE